MFKKLAIFFALALVVAIGVFSVVSTTHAQEIEAVEENPAVQESTDVQVVVHEQAEYQFEYTNQFGEGNGEGDPVMTQTRTRTRDLQDGTCDGEPQQLRLQVGAGNQGEMKQQRLNLGDGTCSGDCVPLRQGNGQGQ
jgi:hypothetical protein